MLAVFMLLVYVSLCPPLGSLLPIFLYTPDLTAKLYHSRAAGASSRP